MKRKVNKIREYFEQKKEVNDLLVNFIESTDEIEIYFYYLQNYIEKSKICEKKEELEYFLRLLSNVSNNYHRKPGFFTKIEKILVYLDQSIRKILPKNDLFNIFLKNKIVLLLLFKNGMITLEETFIEYLINSGESELPRYRHFFLPEITKFISDKKRIEIENEILNFDVMNLEKYDEKRLKGENDSYICSLIREDLIDEFVTYYNRGHFSLNSKIEPSVFETNSFLIGKKPTLIEYSAFYGSIQIFNFLKLNDVELEPSLWLYLIHSKNAEFIHLLEENQVEPFDETYEECLEESIKCHHNDIAVYIMDNLFKPIEEKPKNTANHQADQKYSDFQMSTEERIISYAFKYSNYKFFPKQFNQNYIFFYLSSYKYTKIVRKFIRNKKNEIKAMKIIY